MTITQKINNNTYLTRSNGDLICIGKRYKPNLKIVYTIRPPSAYVLFNRDWNSYLTYRERFSKSEKIRIKTWNLLDINIRSKYRKESKYLRLCYEEWIATDIDLKYCLENFTLNITSSYLTQMKFNMKMQKLNKEKNKEKCLFFSDICGGQSPLTAKYKKQNYEETLWD